MPGLNYGIARAFSVVMGSVVLVAFLKGFSNAGLMGPSLIPLLGILGLIGIGSVMSYWGNEYMAGWLIGQVLLLTTGLVSVFELVFYIGIPAVIMYLRLTKGG